jgi:pSer/pThr/pTyr-binding forkhead associated (FHA) protein
MLSTELLSDRPTSLTPLHLDTPELDAADLDLMALEAEEEEEVIGRADTFVMGEAEDGQAAQYAIRKPAPKYIQGIVAGEQISLITNLTGEGSMTVLQSQQVWTMGRNREAGLPIKDRMMSRRHATIVYLQEEKAFYLLDLNSMNGSYVNGLRVEQRQLLQDGDFLRVGNTEFFFFVSQQQETLEPLHPEVHSKFMAFASQALSEEDLAEA